ncbi:MAG: efflux RND transporter periplasmic adaptor subunit [Desulfarculus sp.]|nr:efflux RND transporter periplasmic adaptor subunit [Desulfarculus sp.]
MNKKIILALGGLLLLALAGGGLYLLFGRPEAPVYKTAKVQRGDIISTVSATGNLAAVVNVQVGTQVSGTIRKIYVDYNSPVKQGQPIAQIDPAIFEAQVEQALGNYQAALAGVQKAKVTVADTRRTLGRNRELIAGDFIARAELDTAQTAHDSALAALLAAEAAVVQTSGALNQARTNLAYSTIRSPVDGTVVSRNVDVGQTVAASFQTPTLFNIAQDLTRMEIDTSVDEADISRVKEGQTAYFTVDSYPEIRFEGQVTQVRGAPVVSQNVVTYVVVIGVDNRELKLKPGMTANVTLEVDHRHGVLRLPTAALRFKPKTPGGAPAAASGQPPAKAKSPVARRVYVLGADGQPTPVAVKTGIGDGNAVELTEGDLREGDEVIIEQAGGKKPAAATGAGRGPRF